MKKIILITVLVVTCFAIQAQVRFGAQAGINGASATFKDETVTPTITEKYKTKIGLNIGIVVEVPIATSLVFRPELNFIQKGGKFSESETVFGTTISTESKFTNNYLELPLNLAYKFEAGSGNVFVGAGPSIGFGLSGKAKTKITTGSTTDEETVNIKFDGKENATDNNVHLKALDFGINFLAGYQIGQNVFIKANYTVGLSNISPEAKTSVKNNGFGFTIGYMFGSSETEK